MRVSLILLLLTAQAALAQGFAGLGLDAEGYALPRPDHALAFPEDHGAHPAYRIEWWYVTANLQDAEGRDYGAQFTLFRQAAAPPPQRDGWASQQFWLGHAALTTKTRHLAAERRARGGVGQAGAVAAPFEAWIDDWGLMAAEGAPGLSDIRMRADAGAFGFDLSLNTDAAPVLQGEAGFSVKSDRGQASYYFSQPYFMAEGEIALEGARISVKGRAWMDREWSSQPLAPDQTGWDWFSLHLSEETKLMLFRLRDRDGGAFISGNWISGGESRPLRPGEAKMIPLARTDVAGRSLPTSWRIELPERGEALEIDAINPKAWNDTAIGYWEGPVRVRGRPEAVGYLEMTGY